MSRFYGELRGSGRTCSTRCGSTSSGMWGHIRGWNIGVTVEMHAEGDEDVVDVYLSGGSNGSQYLHHLGTFREHDLSEPVKAQTLWDLIVGESSPL